MKIALPTTRRKARIEIIPLIDIVFFLLATFVMVSLSMVKNQGITVNLPVAVTGTPQNRDKQIIISISEGQEIYLEKEKITIEALKSRLKNLHSINPELIVFINGDANATFGRAIEILDTVRKIGITKVSIQTKKQPVADENKL